VQALDRTARAFGYEPRILAAVEATNAVQKHRLFELIRGHFGDLRGRTIAVWGLAFKPNTDDMRDSPAIAIAEELQAAGARIRAYDPEGHDQAKLVMKDIDYAADPYDCLTGADIAVLVTEWDAFRALDMDRVKVVMATPAIVDLRNVYRPDEMKRRGISYASVGR
jgi:UDPglucose 6-dehydrogenase